jgi:hypothetical protein
VPLIAEVLEELDNLETTLLRVRDTASRSGPSDNNGNPTRIQTPPIIRVAAQAALLVHNKYLSLLEDCEVYATAIGMSLRVFLICGIIPDPYLLVMSPDKKLDWFRRRSYTEAEILRIRHLVVTRWSETYASSLDGNSPTQPTGGADRSGARVRFSHPWPFTKPHSSCQNISSWSVQKTPEVANFSADSITAYLDKPVVHLSMVNAAGGAMKYWYGQETLRPTVALMTQDFISALGQSESCLYLHHLNLIHLYSHIYRCRAPIFDRTPGYELHATQHVSRHDTCTHGSRFMGWNTSVP